MARAPLLIVALALFNACEGEKPKSEAQPTSAPTSARPQPSANTASAAPTVDRARLGVFGKVPDVMASDKNPITDEKVKLGRMLYFEKRISKNQDLSCNSCHDLARYGVDGESFSLGHKRQRGGRNAPTVYNAAAHFVQFWDGRAPDVEKQAQGPVLNPVEMAMPDDKAVMAVLSSMPEYVDAFKKAFPDDPKPMSYDNFGKAIGAFERKLVTPARFDKYLAGDDSALDASEKKGLGRFLESGCTACHTGPLLGGSLYQKVGAVKAWDNQKDQGRFDVTKQDADKMMFKVPSLRNIEKTGPYFHDASAKTLPEAVSKMGEHQLGKTLSAEDVDAIVKFLASLTGEVPSDYVKAPELPKSTPKTPKPNPN